MDESEGSNKLIVLLVVAVLAGGAAALYFFIRPNDASVAGTVTLDGKPLAGAQVVFLGEEANQAPLVAQSDEQGAYKIVGHTGGGVRPGKYKVCVTKMALKDGTVPMGEKLEQARANGLLRNFLPKAYEDRSTTPLVFDVRPGPNTVALELKKQP